MFGYSVDPIKGHGSPTQNPDTQSRGLSQGDSVGHPAEAHVRSAAGRPLLQLQSTPPGHLATGPTPPPTGELVCCSVCVHLGGCLILLSSVHRALNSIDSSLVTLHFIPKLGVGQPSGRKDLFAFHLGSWWIQSLATRWRLDVDKAKCSSGSEPILSKKKKKITQSKASEVEKVLLGFLEGSFDKKNTAQMGCWLPKHLLEVLRPSPGTDHLQNCFSTLPIQAAGPLSCFQMCKGF